MKKVNMLPDQFRFDHSPKASQKWSILPGVKLTSVVKIFAENGAS